MRCVRVWFHKTGPIRYISHLDLMRTMTRAIRRSRIPLWYTEGFNPHPYMTFALPLSLGMQSECESMDIRIEGEMTNDEICLALQGVMPEGIEITAVKDPVLDPKYIAFARFSVSFENAADPYGLCEQVETLLSGESLIVQKLGKKGHKKVMKEIDLLQSLQSYALRMGGDTLILELTLPAGSANNVNPSLLCDEILKLDPAAYYVITRKQLLTQDMEVFA